MSFQDRLRETAADTEAMLDGLLVLDGNSAGRVVEAMRYASLGQGKRLRPFFVVESAALFDVSRVHALRAGAALECIHCYSLVHDDLPAMDDDKLRRGKPTTHIAFDEATAILAGDGLLTFAFEILAHPDTHPDSAVRADLVLALAGAAGFGGMVGGQMLDLQAEENRSHDLDEIMLIQGLKTGALFRFSCMAGAILGSASLEDRMSLRNYADRVGLAFQIADDILDVESTPEQLGKATQKDAKAGKATFVELLGLEGARARANALIDEACDTLDRFGGKAGILREAARFIVDRKS